MSNYNQTQAHPPAGTAYPQQQQGPYVVPPPVGYPVKDDYNQPPPPAPTETKSRGDGFWKGCCAALCCCCLLDACF